ncbi:SPOR domain-containing protein [Sinimarinibacterium sp. NLF-5-8]|uniref:SPOR domain-containing protein n=1 Tax=Sinimarinibacterium sp. NLF-5-8 TaxID=2698684 RepID=UPI00137C0794|nr:SPOR domain-containing protein [Sinimarinibacterium sp. NLF-5-8]QHS10458.1 hypothetical protein GT972_10170 [Sinimarinibacterium sp. NLF-5-8]
MARNDYAPRGKPRRRTAAPQKNRLPGWVWLLAGLSIGLAVTAFNYITRPVEKTVAAPAPTAAPRENVRKNAPIPLPPREKPRFTFYEILRDQEVVLPQDVARQPSAPAAASGAASTPADDASYIIQVASFRANADADRLKASLALLGIESRIESITIDNKDTYYRVRIGPVRDWNQVQSTMAQLEKNGHPQPMLIKLK